MHFREILVKDVRLNVERTLGLARVIFLSILWGANFIYRYSEYSFFFGATSSANFLFFVGARHFLVCATFQTCATFSRQIEEAGYRSPVAELPTYQIRPSSPKAAKTSGFRILGRLPKLQNGGN